MAIQILNFEKIVIRFNGLIRLAELLKIIDINQK